MAYLLRFNLFFLILGLNASYGMVNLTLPTGADTAPTGLDGQPVDPGFSNVGQVAGSSSTGSGVYLGDGWVLTANHVNAGAFTVGGSTYSYNGVDSYQIGGTDLRLFKLATSPLLPSLSIVDATPALNSDVTMISGGRSPEASTTTWYVETGATWTWSESFFVGAEGTLDGYKTTSTRTVRWGTNEISSFGTYAGADTLVTDFSASGTTYEAQAVRNDSGGGFFVEEGGEWKLAGSIAAVGTYNNQPDNTDSAIIGQSTIAIDLSEYKSEIEAYMVPEPASFALALGLLVFLRAFMHRHRCF